MDKMAKKQSQSQNLHLQCERAIDELKRQEGLIIQKDNKKLGVFPVEFLRKDVYAALTAKKGIKLSLLLTPSRAKSLGLKLKAGERIALKGLGFDEMMGLSDPTYPLPKLIKKLDFVDGAKSTFANMLILTKHASVLPALLVIEGKIPGEWLSLPVKALEHYMRDPKIDAVQTAIAQLPIYGAEHARVVSFRTRHSTNVHLALMVGNVAKAAKPLVRVHSSCVTGDILGSLRCDCGDQLSMAMRRIIAEGTGVLIYLHQEGRGIGITNKLRAYTLQEQGIDTYDANLMLGFEEDERDFAIAAAILKELGMSRIRLLTNNPSKLDVLKKHGIKIEGRIPLVAMRSAHNHAYLAAKSKAGHQF